MTLTVRHARSAMPGSTRFPRSEHGNALGVGFMFTNAVQESRRLRNYASAPILPVAAATS